MNNADLDTQQINAIADMTTAEVRDGLRQFGLRPIECLPLELSRWSTVEQRSDASAKINQTGEETSNVMTVEPNGAIGLENLRDNPAWAAIRRQLQSLKNTWRLSVFMRVATMSSLAILIVTSAFGVRAVFDLFDKPGSKEISFVHFQPDEERLLREAMTMKLSSRCTDAFMSVKLRSPSEVISKVGLEIRPARDLYLYSAKALGLNYEQTRITYMEGFSSGRAQSGSVPRLRDGVQMTSDGRPRIFLHDTAFLGESFLFGRYSLNDVLTHEFIHVGGQQSTPGLLGPLQHDLAGFEHYDKIMEACK